MLPPRDDAVRTRSSLLRRVRRWDDETSWKDFHDTYKRIIRSVACQAGLSEAEADDVVQDTFLEVAKKMPAFQYDPKRGSFKAWLLKLTRWRILDFLRQRQRARAVLATGTARRTRTALIERVPDPAGADLEGLLEKEWQAEVVRLALLNVRRRVDPEKFQIFDLYVQRGWPAEKVARTLGVTLNQVYLAKHRITESLKAEVAKLEAAGAAQAMGSRLNC